MAAAALTALLPLEPPPPPPLPWWDGQAPLLLGLIAALLLAGWWLRPAARRGRRLGRLRRRLTRPAADTRALAAELDTLLRQATRRTRLTADQRPPTLPEQDWRTLLQTLQRARFAAGPAAADALLAVLPVARRAMRTGNG